MQCNYSLKEIHLPLFSLAKEHRSYCWHCNEKGALTFLGHCLRKPSSHKLISRGPLRLQLPRQIVAGGLGYVEATAAIVQMF